MTTSQPPFPAGMSLRSTRVLRAPPPPPPSLLPNESAPTADSHLTPNFPPLDELPSIRIEKDSSSPLHPEQQKEKEPDKEQERRLTRSRANSIGITGAALGSCETPAVAIERMVHRKDEHSAKKKEKMTTQGETPPTPEVVMQVVVPKGQEAILPIVSIPTQKKTPSKPITPPETTIPLPVTTTLPLPISAPPTPTAVPSTFLSPYGDYRKSYRKTTKTQILSFPYRKHHDPLEGRIISMLNKLTGDRDCRKELENLGQRVAKAGGRECRNRYVVAGMKMVVRMAKERQKLGGMTDSRIVSRLGQEVKTLQGKIVAELEDYSQYLPRESISPPKRKDHHAAQYRSLVMKKLYSVLKQTKRMSKPALRERVVAECEGFFRGELSMDEMLRFVRRRLEEEEV